jgi:hypothetical protein
MANTSIYSFTIFNQPPEAPILIDPGTVISVDHFTLSWTTPDDLEGPIDHYLVQMGADVNFTLILGEHNVTLTEREFTGLSNGVYYFRVLAVDGHGAYGNWSNVESIEIQVSATTTTTTPSTTPTNGTTTSTNGATGLTPTDTTTPPTTDGGPFDPDLLSLVVLIVTGGSMLIIVVIVITIIRQRSSARQQYQF